MKRMKHMKEMEGMKRAFSFGRALVTPAMRRESSIRFISFTCFILFMV